MNYFIAMKLGNSLTGIESAQIKRMKLFKQMNLQATCVYTNFNAFLYENAKKFGLDHNYLSLYDYFQNCVDYTEEKKFDWLTYWEKTCLFTIKKINDTTDVRVYNQNNTFIMYAHFNNAWYEKLIYINYFDGVRKVRREHYDCRGFLSRETLLGENQRVLAEYYYTPTGKRVLEKYYELQNNNYKVVRIFVKDDEERAYIFENEGALQTFFFNNLYQKGDVYFCDRNKLLAEPLLKVNKDIPICSVLHSVHTRNVNDPLNSTITSPYRVTLANRERFSHIIVSTNQQRKELEERFPDYKHFITIPVGYNENENKTGNSIIKNKLIGVSRYSEEKQVDHQIDLMKRLISDFPDATLYLYGFGKEQEHLKKMIEENHLEDHVFLEGFQTDLSNAYETSNLSLLTSRVEGFSLALLEAQSHGVPSISYDVRYGPGEIIEEGLNGYLVEKNNQEQLYEKVKQFLLDENIQNRMRMGSQEVAKKYSSEVVGTSWENLLTTIHSENESKG